MRPAARVVVAGAGLAGLVAARELHNAGLNVTVFEARPRVGGRLWSVLLDNDAVVELGGEWIDEKDAALLDLAGVLGLETVETGLDFTVRTPVPGPEPSVSQQLEAMAVARSVLETATLEGITAERFLAGLDGPSAALRMIGSRLEASWAVPLDRIPAADLNASFALAVGRTYHRIHGGNQRLAEALAAQLSVEVGMEVTRVARVAGGLEVSCSGAAGSVELACDAVVIAVPAPLIARIDLGGVVPEAVRNTWAEVPMGRAAKLAVAADDPPLLSVQPTGMSWWAWSGVEPDGSVRRAISAFAGSASTLAALRVPEGESVWMEAVSAAIPSVPLVGQPVMHDWSVDPWSRGCYSAVASPARIEAAWNPGGGVVFAGEHTNGSGTMNGAVLSGLRAARSLLAG